MDGKEQGPGARDQGLRTELIEVLERLVKDCESYTTGCGCVGCAGEPVYCGETNEEEVEHEPDCTILRAKALIQVAKKGCEAWKAALIEQIEAIYRDHNYRPQGKPLGGYTTEQLAAHLKQLEAGAYEWMQGGRTGDRRPETEAKKGAGLPSPVSGQS